MEAVKLDGVLMMMKTKGIGCLRGVRMSLLLVKDGF